MADEEVSTHEAKTQLSRLISRVMKGERIVILRGSQPAARLVPIDPKAAVASGRPKVGTLTSAPVKATKDAFEPLSDQELRDWGL